MSKFAIGLASMILLFSPEARVSQVSHFERQIPYSTLVPLSHEIWIAKEIKKDVVIKRIVFPKETHWKKSSETVFEQFANQFELISPLKQSDSKLKPGQKVNLLIETGYGEQMVKIYHEQNQSESPIVDRYQSQFQPKENQNRIIFFRASKAYPEAFDHVQGAIEGLEAKTKILAEIQSKSHATTDAFPDNVTQPADQRRSRDQVAAFNKEVRLPEGQSVQFPDGLSLQLNSFSHKRTRTGDPTHASAYFDYTKQDVKIPFGFSSSGGSQSEGFFFREYFFEMTGFNYGVEVRFIVRPLPVKKVQYQKVFSLKKDEVALFEDFYKVRVAGFGSEKHKETQKDVAFVKIDILMDGNGEPLSQKLYETGLQILYGTWAGDPGLTVSQRNIQLKSLQKDQVELIVKKIP